MCLISLALVGLALGARGGSDDESSSGSGSSSGSSAGKEGALTVK